jgi:hypothetical protein
MLNICVLGIKTVFAFGGAMKRVSVATGELVETSHAAKSPIKPSSARNFRERKSAVICCSCILHCSSSGLVSEISSPPTPIAWQIGSSILFNTGFADRSFAADSFHRTNLPPSVGPVRHLDYGTKTALRPPRQYFCKNAIW